MRQSQIFVKTKKTSPKEALAVSHQLLLKADFIEQLASGIYSFLPLGWKVHQKIAGIVREEMNAISGQEVFMPALQPKEMWQKTGRWEKIDPPLFKLKDRHKKDLALGSTHEEVVAELCKNRIQSYKDLPLYLYQIQNKFRNEMRSTGGLLRTREFVMKDLYSFHESEEDFQRYYQIVTDAYFRIFKRCGLNPVLTQASGAGFTKEYTHEFQVIAPAGEDTIIFCPAGHFSQNKEIASAKEGGKCPICQKTLSQARSIEVGNIFPLGTKYTEAVGVYFKDRAGEEAPAVMGCYGIGLGRLLATSVEVHNDKNGIIWPKEIAPFSAHLIPVENNEKVKEQAEKIYSDLLNSGIDLIYDDRDKSAGEKFADADLIGIPVRLVVSEKTLEKNCVEMKKRGEEKKILVAIEDIVKELKAQNVK